MATAESGAPWRVLGVGVTSGEERDVNHVARTVRGWSDQSWQINVGGHPVNGHQRESRVSLGWAECG
ncbi:hypothetical protein Aglo03_60670 [Actinokineospora globicatena]|uniref:Uncharacterized protein n=1 Tax=Actinokineospora globicatena TaxID=103729 RepID=A0A9W6QQV3_9PSEU|nr:hypothetical protein Aglo03_60670 [Actinokineospora globicatena]